MAPRKKLLPVAPKTLYIDVVVRNAGLRGDRLHVSAETRIRKLYTARRATMRRLAEEGEYDLLRARQAGRLTTAAIHNACKKNFELGVAALRRKLADEGATAARPSPSERPVLADLPRYEGELRRTGRRSHALQLQQIRDLLAEIGRRLHPETRARQEPEAYDATLPTPPTPTPRPARGEVRRLMRRTAAARREYRQALAAALRARSEQETVWAGRVRWVDLKGPVVTDALGRLPDRRAVQQGRLASGATQNRYRAALSGACAWAVREEILAGHPLSRGAVKKSAEAGAHVVHFEPHQYAAYVAAAGTKLVRDRATGEYRCRPDAVLFLKLLMATGADVGELHAREPHDFALGTAPHVRLQQSKIKDAPPRPVSIDRRLAAEVRDHIAANAAEIALDPRQRVFCALTRGVIRAVHKAGAAAVGSIRVDKDPGDARRERRRAVTLKDLRHVAAVAWLDGGASIEDVRVWLGHTSLAETAKYLGRGALSDRAALLAERTAVALRGTESRDHAPSGR